MWEFYLPKSNRCDDEVFGKFKKRYSDHGSCKNKKIGNYGINIGKGFELVRWSLMA